MVNAKGLTPVQLRLLSNVYAEHQHNNFHRKRFMTMAPGSADGSQSSPLKVDRLPITVKGKIKLEEELKRLIQVERPAVVRAIEEARAHGDLSENAEYDAAKERQSMIEGRINEIQGHLAGAEVVDPSTLSGDRVIFGAHVEVVDTETEEEASYQIVGVDEADVKEGRVSILSPIARALIGKRVGDIVTVRSPKGDKELEITGLSFK